MHHIHGLKPLMISKLIDMRKIFFFLGAVGIFSGCSTTKNVQVEKVEETILEPLIVDENDGKTIEEVPFYNPSATRLHDLIHTKLEVSFDYAKKHLFGKATLTLKPYFHATDEVILDAKGFDIHSIRLNSKDGQELKYNYEAFKLTIKLDKVYNREQEYTLFIDYTAKPDEIEGLGASEAIAGEKGLYFINPSGDDKNKPVQIWTQGETEFNSCWFPTIDKPNERSTQEMYITVNSKYKTLSNGVKQWGSLIIKMVRERIIGRWINRMLLTYL